MAETTGNLGLPLMVAGQAQKHITHNEALLILDLLVQGAVLDHDRSEPPAAPQEGACHIVAAGASGAWAGKQGQIAAFLNNGWLFLQPKAGWRLHLLSTQEALHFDGSIWRSTAQMAARFDRLGLNATADGTNRLNLSAAASLFNHAGAGHQVKINKAAVAETASLLFQTGYAGRAEMGLTGADDFSIKVSADGTSFIEALRFSRSTGLAAGEAVVQSASDVGAGRLLKVGAGYQQLDQSLYRRGNILGTVSQTAGQVSGALIERGSTGNGEYSRFADGTQMVWMKKSITPVASVVSTSAWTFPQPFVSAAAVVVQLSVQNATPSSEVISLSYANQTASGCDLKLYRTSATATEIAAMAIGRWI